MVGSQLDESPDVHEIGLIDRPAAKWEGVAAIGVGVLMGVAVIAQVRGLNGPWYWKWHYARMWPVPVYGGMALAAIPLLVGLVVYEWGSARGRRWGWVMLAGAVVTTFAARLVWMAVHSESLDLVWLPWTVRHPLIVSYYTDAQGLVNFPGWLAHYDEVLGVLSAHSRNKPPGPILFCYAFIKMFGDSQRTGMIVGVALAALEALGILGAWFFLRVLGRSGRAAVYGAAFLALCPGFVLFFPMFDSLYVGLVSVLIALWALAVERDRWWLGALTGVVLMITSVMTFNFLVIGLFMAGYAIFCTPRRTAAALVVTAKQATAALVTLVAAYVVMYLITGYNPIRAFFAALEHQKYLLTLPTVVRPYPQTALFDLTDFALGSTWIGFVLAGLWVAHALRSAPRAPETRIVLLCVVQLIGVAATGLLPGETARVWNFLYPLLMLPVGLEMERLPRAGRIGVYCAELFVLAALAQNMIFL